MRPVLLFLAGRRWAGVGLALLVEVVALVALALAPAADVVGMPAAVATTIAGTVAVVFGVVDGVAVAATGAVVFAALSGWEAGAVASIGVWPAIVAAVGVFARRVERHRAALHELVDAQESERRSLALTLHDESAQTLTGALLSLRAAGVAPGETDQARELINETIRQLRRLAVELSPKALEDYGLGAALGHLAEGESARTGASVEFGGDWDGRLPEEAERTLFRFAQSTVTAALDAGSRRLGITLHGERRRVGVAVSVRDGRDGAVAVPGSIAERLRMLGGRVTDERRDGERIIRADVPAELRRPAGSAGGAA